MAEKRVLICGGRRKRQAVWSIARGFARMDFMTEYCPTRRWETDKAVSKGEAIENLREVVQEFQPSLLFWVMCKGDCVEDTIPELKKTAPGLVTVFHSFDDPFEADVVSPSQPAWFDFAVTCCEGSVKWYEKQGTPAICLYPPADEELHGQAEPDPAEACDVSFAANNVYPRDKYGDVLLSRAEMVRAIYAEVTKSLHLYGGWGQKRCDWGGPDGVPKLRGCYRGFKLYEDMPRVFAASKINLNSHVRPDGYRYLNERTITCMGSGGFMLSDHVNGIEEIFDIGKELDTWRTPVELEVKARYWLTHPEEREAVALAGKKRVLAEHSNVAFVRKLLNFCGMGELI